MRDFFHKVCPSKFLCILPIFTVQKKSENENGKNISRFSNGYRHQSVWANRHTQRNNKLPHYRNFQRGNILPRESGLERKCGERHTIKCTFHKIGKILLYWACLAILRDYWPSARSVYGKIADRGSFRSNTKSRCVWTMNSLASRLPLKIFNL